MKQWISCMLDTIIYVLVKTLLWLRYSTTITGLKDIKARGTAGILFLPNHPALIDPIIVTAALFKDFRVRPLGYQDQVDRPVIRRLAERIRVLAIPDMARTGKQGRGVVEKAIETIIQGLKTGENILLYPAGRTYRQRFEEIGGTSAVDTILRALPDVRVVLVRITGLWGSGFSRARANPPVVGDVLKKAFFAVLANGIFFVPRRHISLEFVETDEFPRCAERLSINRYLEKFYNSSAPPNTYVPYLWWEKGGTRTVREPVRLQLEGDPGAVPAATKKLVLEYLQEVSGCSNVKETDRLGHDLGMDSILLVDLSLWLEQEFGFQQTYADSLRTVADVLLAACGQAVSLEPEGLQAVGKGWFKTIPGSPRIFSSGTRSLTRAFLCQARSSPGKTIVADQISGEKTYRDLLTAILVLKPEIEKIKEPHVGIMLPATVACTTLYWAALFAGKTPVMINWTIGPRNLQHTLALSEVSTILTSSQVVRRLSARGIDFASIQDTFLYVDDLAGRISGGRKIAAWLASRLNRHNLEAVSTAHYAAMLFTSGSESLPKIVPLTHDNIFSNVTDICLSITTVNRDRLAGILPPFHSLGLTGTVVFPLCLGIPTVYHANPTEAALIAQTVEAYRATIILGTPTFLNNIVRVAPEGQLDSLRLAVTGAEKCPETVYNAFARQCPQLNVIEGYGTTECSPAVTLGDANDPKPGTIGRVLPSFEYIIVDPDTCGPVQRGQRGILLVRGPAVFEGYYRYEGPAPFVELQGKQWYQTGDLVIEDAAGVLSFVGRRKRFVKLGGEMISLPAIEAVLEQHFPAGTKGEPCFAIEATPDEINPELVMFTTVEVDRQTVNHYIRDGGLSALHNIRRIILLDEIPLLGTGKTDYRALKERLQATV